MELPGGREQFKRNTDCEVPTVSENVLIGPTMHVMLDVNPPCLWRLVIQGKLEFHYKDLELCATSIAVQGTGALQVQWRGWALYEPWQKKVWSVFRSNQYRKGCFGTF